MTFSDCPALASRTVLTASILGAMLLSTPGLSVAQPKTVELKFAHIWPATHPFQKCGIDKIHDQLAKDPSGVRIRAFSSEQLGTMAQLGDSVAAGTVDLSIFGSSYLGTRYGPLNVLDAAYVFRDVDHASRVNESEIGAKLWKGLLEKTGIRRIDNWVYGARHITSNKPIHKPADLEGVKFRVPDNQLMVANAKAMGATPVPMAFGEVYLALKMGTIDAEENPLTVIDTSKFAEVQKYLSLTSHMIQVSPVVISEKSWQKLSPAQQTALTNAIKGVTSKVNECVSTSEKELLDKWSKGTGMKVIPPADIDLDAFRAKARETLTKRYADEWADIYTAIQDFK
ncbi:MAG: DctP family TRAP transporter solute-binding subunit [Lautropia sp.]|nr:DctP family TRAP transporter solute-binding subunit [Lautropia sp.]